MKKVMFATLLGGFLGVFDGLTALFTPEVRDQIVGIVIGSTVKGLVTGVIVGFFATKVHSLVLGTLFFWLWRVGRRRARAASPAAGLSTDFG